MFQIVGEASDIRCYDIAEFAVMQVEGQIADRLLGAVPRPVPIATGYKLLFVDGSQQLGTGQLDQLVFDGGNAQRSLFSVLFGYVATNYQFGTITLSAQSLRQRLGIGL